jgi:Zn finger protein HypA/HybF involved in hydrogenase expression
MHELAATQGLLTAALERMRTVGASRVTGLEVTIGASGHLSEDSVRQHFALLARDTPAEGAALAFIWLPATYQCFACLNRFTSAESPVAVTCPACGGVALEIAHPEVYYASAIEVAFTGEVGSAAVPAGEAGSAQGQ